MVNLSGSGPFICYQPVMSWRKIFFTSIKGLYKMHNYCLRGSVKSRIFLKTPQCQQTLIFHFQSFYLIFGNAFPFLKFLQLLFQISAIVNYWNLQWFALRLNSNEAFKFKTQVVLVVKSQLWKCIFLLLFSPSISSSVSR